jgi:hypothetical protein
MVERDKPRFGQRSTIAPDARALKTRPLAGSSMPQQSPHVIYRDGETQRPTFHDSHIEKHWPKYLAVAAAVFALVFLISDGKRDAFGLAVVPILFGGLSYLFLNGLRKSLNGMHTVRTQLFRSRPFLAGGVLGLSYFIYSTFIQPTTVMGVEWGLQTAFDDGFQQQDLGAVAMLLLKAAGYMVMGGIAVEFIARKLFGADKAETTK